MFFAGASKFMKFYGSNSQIISLQPKFLFLHNGHSQDYLSDL